MKISEKQIQRVVRDLRQNNPYPVNLFAEPHKGEWENVGLLIREHGWSAEKIFGKWGRMVWENCVDTVQEYIQHEVEAVRGLQPAGWTKDRPEFGATHMEGGIVVCATWCKGNQMWFYDAYEVIYDGYWKWLNMDGEEIGDIHDMEGEYYMVIPKLRAKHEQGKV